MLLPFNFKLDEVCGAPITFELAVVMSTFSFSNLKFFVSCLNSVWKCLWGNLVVVVFAWKTGFDGGCGFLSILGCCGSSLTNLSADGVLNSVFVPLVDSDVEVEVLVTLFDALNAKGFVEEWSGVLSKTNSFLLYLVVNPVKS